MVIFYYCNLALATVLLVVPFWWSKQYLKLDFWNPISIATLSALPFGLFRLYAGQIGSENGLLYFPYQFAVLMTNFQQFTFTLLLIFFLKTRLASRAIYALPRLGTYSRQQLRILSLAFMVLYASAFLILVIKTGGLWNWLSDIRGSYITKREGNGIYYSGALLFLSISYFLRGISSRNKRSFTVVSLVYFALVYVLGSKGFVLQFFIFYIVILWKQETVNIGHVLSFGLPSILLLMLINFYSQREVIQLSSVYEYFDYYNNAAMYYYDYFSGSIDLFRGKVLLSSFWEYVPRALYTEKPFVYGALHITEHYYPGGAESGNTPAFYGGVPEFADFGIVGVLTQAIINPSVFIYAAGLHYALKQREFSNMELYTGRSILICLLLFGPAFGAFIPIALLSLVLVFLFLFARLVLLLVSLLRLAASVPPYDIIVDNEK